MKIRDLLLEHYLETIAHDHVVVVSCLREFVNCIPACIEFKRITTIGGHRLEVNNSAAGDNFRVLRLWGHGWNTSAVIHKVGARWGLT